MKKKTYAFIFSCFSLYSFGQIVNIPDVNFKNALLYSACASSETVLGSLHDVDTNNDGEIEVNEASAIVLLNVNGKSISSLEGIAAFGNLGYLKCNYNLLTSLDVTNLPLRNIECEGNQITTIIHGNLPTLEYLNCSYNLLTTLDASQFPNLIYLYCGNTALTSINLNGLQYLTQLYAQNTLLTSIDCSQTAVITLYCNDSPNLTSINVRNNVQSAIWCEECLINFDFYNLPNLSTVCVDNGEENVLFFIPQTTQVFGGPNCDILLGISSNNIEDTIALYPNPVNQELHLETKTANTLQSIQLYNSLGQLVKTLSIPEFSSSMVINVSALIAGTYFIEINSNQGKTTKKFVKI